MDWRWPLAALGAALALMTAPAAPAAAKDPPASAGWHGREIRDPRSTPVSDTIARFPRGWSAGAVRTGTGYASPNGSRRVREVQRRLVRRGYRAGPLDGRFGPRTRAAVTWFQIKHGLPRTGRVDARSLATLRADRVIERTRSTTPRADRPVAAGPTAAAPEPAGESWVPLLVAFAIALAAASIVLWRRRKHPAPASDAQPRPRLTVLRSPAPTEVLGYVAVARDADVDTSARIIGSWCEARGWPLARVVHDVAPAKRPMADRPGLGHVLDQIAEGRVAGVVVARLTDLTSSLSEMATLLEWIDASQAFLIAVDYELAASAATDPEYVATPGRWDR